MTRGAAPVSVQMKEFVVAREKLVMKCIGLIGGMSWESSLEYYRFLNQDMARRLGGFHSARIVMYSVDFSDIETCMIKGQWDKAAEILIDAGQRLERAGADFILVCTNTLHKVAGEIAGALNIPLLHIGDAVGREANRLGFNRVGLLGTAFTMEDDFMRSYLLDRYGLEALIPGYHDRQSLQTIIFKELCLGKFFEKSRERILEIIRYLADQGAEAAILGCTELPLVIKPERSPLPLLDTTALHAAQAVDLALT
jgi:aspartate racemase